MKSGKYYPLHLHKSLEYISKIMPFISLIVLLTDSRVPFLESLYLKEIKRRWPQKNVLSIFTKADLVRETDAHNSFNLFKPSSRHKIIKLLKETLQGLNLTPRESTNSIVVMGGANSGKSSFINLLANRKKTKRAAEPGTTRGISRHRIPLTNLLLYDCPGFFPDKVDTNLSALLQLLNFLPKIPDNTINFAEWGFNYLLKNYPEKLKSWVGNNSGNSENYYSFLKEIALKYKLVEKGGMLSMNKAEEKFINLVRKGEFGRITWEI